MIRVGVQYQLMAYFSHVKNCEHLQSSRGFEFLLHLMHGIGVVDDALVKNLEVDNTMRLPSALGKHISGKVYGLILFSMRLAFFICCTYSLIAYTTDGDI